MTDRTCVLALILFGFLAFFNAIHHPFVHDDVIFILNNPHVTQLDHWYEAFKVPAVAEGLNTYYRPLLEVFYRLEYHFFGPYPAGYHLVNIIIHIINGLLIFALLQKLGFARHVAWVIACIFLIHPLQTEAVSCISGISNLWMALFLLLALHAYLYRWYAATLIGFIIAFLGKEQAIMFLGLVMVIDYYRREKNFRPWLVLWFVTAILLWIRQAVTGTSLLKDVMASPGELYLRLAAIPRDVEMYLRLIFFPYDLHYYRSTDVLQSNTTAWALAVIFISVFFYAFFRWPKARRVMVFGFGWFWAALSPVLNIAPLINEYSFILTPEHFLYLPIIGILILVVSAADQIRDRHYFLKIVSVPNFLLGLVISGCLLLTWHQNTYWASETALFERMMQFEPNFGRGHWLLAKAYSANGRWQEADVHFKEAFTIMSGYAKKASNSIAKNFYIRYERRILSDWAQNDKMLGNSKA